MNKIRTLILNKIRNYYGNCDDPEDITSNVLQDMLFLIDKYYYKDSISHILKHDGIDLTFFTNMDGVPDNDIYNYVGYTRIGYYQSTSKELNQRNNKLVPLDIPQISIHIDVEYVYEALETKDGKSKSGGIACFRLLDCLLITMEHESLHLLEFLGLADFHGHDKNFTRELKNIFGHTSINHQH